MPVRLIREDIITSDRIDMLDAAAEVFYRRLLNKVDDYGLYDARLSILRANLYPLRIDRVREADITRWIAACEKAGVIALYSHGDKPYLQVLRTRWQARSEPKFPLPPWGKDSAPEPVDKSGETHSENTCEQVQTGAHLDVFVVEDVFGVGVGDVTCAPSAPKGGLFPIFWAAYPRKEGKAPAEKAFDKLKPDLPLLEAMLSAIRAQAQSDRWRKDGGQFIPMATTWLNQRRWEDQVQVQMPSASSKFGDCDAVEPA